MARLLAAVVLASLALGPAAQADEPTVDERRAAASTALLGVLSRTAAAIRDVGMLVPDAVEDRLVEDIGALFREGADSHGGLTELRGDGGTDRWKLRSVAHLQDADAVTGQTIKAVLARGQQTVDHAGLTIGDEDGAHTMVRSEGDRSQRSRAFVVGSAIVMVSDSAHRLVKDRAKKKEPGRRHPRIKVERRVEYLFSRVSGKVVELGEEDARSLHQIRKDGLSYASYQKGVVERLAALGVEIVPGGGAFGPVEIRFKDEGPGERRFAWTSGKIDKHGQLRKGRAVPVAPRTRRGR